jgi:hypothetical protein
VAQLGQRVLGLWWDGRVDGWTGVPMNHIVENPDEARARSLVEAVRESPV